MLTNWFRAIFLEFVRIAILIYLYAFCYQGCREDLHYAALNLNLPNRSRRQRNNTNSECVYSSVKH